MTSTAGVSGLRALQRAWESLVPQMSRATFEFRGRVNHALFNPDDRNDLWLSGVDLVEGQLVAQEHHLPDQTIARLPLLTAYRA